MLCSALTAGRFLLRRQKKSAKEKAPPGSAVGCADCPALLAKPGGCATRACGPQTVLADCPRLACVARRCTGGTASERKRRCAKIRMVFCLALCGVEQRRAQREKGRGLSEPRRGEFRSPPLRPSSAEHPAQPGDAAGARFLCLLSFGKTKESNAARQARNTAHPHHQCLRPLTC